MDWHTFWTGLLGSLVGSGLGGIALQAFLSHKFAEKLEQFKTSLSASLFERQTRFAWLHSERSKALVRLYRLLAKTDRAYTDMLRPIQGGGEDQTAKKARANDAAYALFEFYDLNRVFFNRELVEKLNDIEFQYRKIWLDFEPNSDNPQKMACRLGEVDRGCKAD